MLQHTLSNKLTWGVGLECPYEVEEMDGVDQLLSSLGNIEFIVEGMMYGRRQSFLDKVAKAGTPVVGHSVELSIGTAEPIRLKPLEAIKAVLEQVNTVVYSDHICMTEAKGVEIGQLTTLPWTMATVDVICRKIEQMQRILPWPLLLENITNRFIVPRNELDEKRFINEITRRSGVGFLLDLTNLYTNSVNFGFDPYEWFSEIDKPSVKGIHLAGGEWEDGTLYDTHSRPVYPEVWDLLEHVLKSTEPDFIVVEWDQDIPSIARLVDEVVKAEAIVTKAKVLKAKPNSVTSRKRIVPSQVEGRV